MLQLKKPLVFIDVEATGTNVCADRIVEIAMVKNQPDGNRSVKRKLINPQIPIPAVVTDIHGITDEMIKDAPTFKQAAQDIKQFLHGCDMAFYNAFRLDLPILMEEFLRAEIEFDMKSKKVIDVQKIFHQMEQR
ncbi:MAG: 3'-5' exonuclease, partial [Flavisolibacter sp.]|nr:3'-5' exonuclease [Flavisolibacter sp.]